MRISYSKPGVDMTAEGHIGGRTFALESDGKAIRSTVTVRGMLGHEDFELGGRTKNFINRNFSVAGMWAEMQLELHVEAKGGRFRIGGSVGDTPIRYEVQRRFGERLSVCKPDDAAFDLYFRLRSDPVLHGRTPDFRSAGIVAAFLPCLFRHQHGSIDAIPSTGLDTFGSWR